MRILSAFIAGLLLLSGTAVSQSSSEAEAIQKLFTIRNIAADVRAESAAAARTKALNDTQVRAFDLLMGKLIQPEDRARLDDISAEEAQRLISGIDILDEATSARRYVARMTVRFNPANVSSFLRQRNIPHVLSAGRDIRVLHVHQDGPVDYLWQVPASMQTARASLDLDNRVRRYAFVEPSLRWRAAVSALQLAEQPRRALETAVERTGSGEAILVLISRRVADGRLRFEAYSSERGSVEDGMIAAAPSADQQFAELYQTVFDRLDSKWRQQLLVDTGVQGSLAALVDSRDPAALAEIITALRGISLVVNVKVVEIALPESAIQLIYAGRTEQLQLALAYAGLRLDVVGEGLYKISQSTASAADANTAS